MSSRDTLVSRLLEQERGRIQDDLHRARAAFRGLTPEQMRERHGESGRSRSSILRGYEQRLRDFERALEDG